MKEEDKLRAELAETKAKLRDAEFRLNQLAGDMKSRLDQLTSGQRSAFEERLLQWLRIKWVERTPHWAWVHVENPLFNTQRAEIIIQYLDTLAARSDSGGTALERYNRMRDALAVMLERLPPLTDKLDQIKS